MTVRITLDPSWIDAYGHLNEGYYLVAFSQAMWPFQEELGLGAAYTSSTSNAIYTVESRIRYLHEVSFPADLDISNSLCAVTDKKIWTTHGLLVNGVECCRLERISLNYNQKTKSVTAFSADCYIKLSQACVSAAPDWATFQPKMDIAPKHQTQTDP